MAAAVALTPWWEGIEPVTVIADCGGGRHRVSWRRGRLVLDDHPHHEAERALVALGGANVCLEVLDAWGAAGVDTRQVLYALQSTLDPVAGAAAVLGPFSPGARPAAFVPPPGMEAAMVARIRETLARQETQQLVGRLPPPLALRWAMGAIVHHERQWHLVRSMERLDLEIGLGTLLTGAVVESALAWRRLDQVGRINLDVGIAAPREHPVIDAQVDGWSLTGRASVRLSWLVEVWARGRAVVDGCFVLRVDGDRADVVRWERWRADVARSVTVPARLRQDRAGRWHLRW